MKGTLGKIGFGLAGIVACASVMSAGVQTAVALPYPAQIDINLAHGPNGVTPDGNWGTDVNEGTYVEYPVWNNIIGGGTLDDLVDTNGVSSPISVTVSADTSGGYTGSSNPMLYSYLGWDDTETVTISGIAQQDDLYNIFVYNYGGGSVNSGDGGATAEITTPGDPNDGHTSFSGVTPEGSSSLMFLLARPNSSGVISFTVTGPGAILNGIQLAQPVPGPGTLGILAAGGMALFLAVRRHNLSA